MSTKPRSSTPNLSILKQALFELFEKFDENHDNLIDPEEFKKAMTHSGFVDPNAPNIDARISQLFAKFDTDNSGTIKYTEFMDEGSKFTAFLNHLNIPFVDDTVEEEDDLKSELSEHELLYPKKADDLEQKVADLQAWIDEYGQKYKSKMLQYKDEKDTTEMKLAIMMQKSEAMEEEIRRMKDDKTILETNASELRKEIMELKNDKIHLQSLSTLGQNDNESQLQKEIFELTNKCEKNRNDLMLYKSKNQEQVMHIKAVTNKANKLETINKQLQSDNVQLIQSTDDLSLYCNELEINLENAQKAINEFNNESLYDNLKENPMSTAPINAPRRSRRTNTIHMTGYDELEHDEYDELDFGDEPTLERHNRNTQSYQPFIRSKRRAHVASLSLRSRANTTAPINDIMDITHDNKDIKEVQNILTSIKSDIKAMSIEMNENEDVLNAINQSFALFKADILKNMRQDLNEIMEEKFIEMQNKEKEKRSKYWWEWW